MPRARIYDLVSGLRTPIRAPQLHRCIIRGRTDGSIRLRAELPQKPLASRGASTDEFRALEGPLELSVKTGCFVGQVGWFLVFGFAASNLEGDAVVLAPIPNQIGPERLVVSPPELGIGDGRDVVLSYEGTA